MLGQTICKILEYKTQNILKSSCEFLLQVAVKNNIDVFYFATIVPTHVYFTEDGAMEKKVFLATWKDIPAQNEIQFTIEGTECNSDGVSTKMHQNNVFTVAKRTLEGQDMVYQSIKFSNNVWALCELKLSPTSDVISVRENTFVSN